ncbi:MAG: hypothetical protein AB1758_22945, partial [Candidatus Eremiobacterota bacterium]
KARSGEQELPTSCGGDGKVYVTLQPGGGAAAVFDPNTLEYGLSGGVVANPTGWQRDRVETLTADGVRRYQFKEEVKGAYHEWTEVRWDGQSVKAERIVRKLNQNQGPRDLSGQLSDGLSRYVNGPDNQNIPLGLTVLGDGSFQIAPPSLGDTASKNAVKLLLGDVITPFMQHQKQQGWAGTFRPFSGEAPKGLFPQLSNQEAPSAVGPPPTPVATPQPAWAQTNPGQPAIPGMPAFPSQPPRPPAPPPPSPVSDPARELSARYPGLPAQKIQAALFLADGDPARADRILKAAQG